MQIASRHSKAPGQVLHLTSYQGRQACIAWDQGRTCPQFCHYQHTLINCKGGHPSGSYPSRPNLAAGQNSWAVFSTLSLTAKAVTPRDLAAGQTSWVDAPPRARRSIKGGTSVNSPKSRLIGKKVKIVDWMAGTPVNSRNRQSVGNRGRFVGVGKKIGSSALVGKRIGRQGVGRKKGRSGNDGLFSVDPEPRLRLQTEKARVELWGKLLGFLSRTVHMGRSCHNMKNKCRENSKYRSHSNLSCS